MFLIVCSRRRNRSPALRRVSRKVSTRSFSPGDSSLSGDNLPEPCDISVISAREGKVTRDYTRAYANRGERVACRQCVRVGVGVTPR